MQNVFPSSKMLKLAALLFLCQSAYAQRFIVKGTILGKDTGVVILKYMNASKKHCSDTATLNHGNFQFSGTVKGAGYAMLDTDPTYTDGDNKYSRLLFIEPGRIVMAFGDGNISSATIKGANVQDESDALRKRSSKEIQKMKALSSARDSIRLQLRNGSIAPDVAAQKVKDIGKQMLPFEQAIRRTEASYIRSHPDSYLSLSLLKYSIGHASNDSVEASYARLSDNVKNSSLGWDFLEYYSKYKKAFGDEYAFDKIKMQQRAPAFSVYTSKADSLTLDDFKGSVVLLEFWELTCLPCLYANPRIEKLRKQYPDNEFKIIAITSTSADDLAKLTSYIARNKVSNWIHVSTNNAYKQTSKLVFGGEFKQYNGLGVPRTILIDRDGKVIFKNLGYSSEDMKSLESLVENIMNKKSIAQEVN